MMKMMGRMTTASATMTRTWATLTNDENHSAHWCRGFACHLQHLEDAPGQQADRA
jgi:hypothetical protein